MNLSLKIRHIFIAISVLISFASAIHAEETEKLQITEAQIQEIIKALPRTEKSLTLYHWTSLETWLRWVAQDEVHFEEFQALLGNSDNMAAGGGLYLASDSDSSRKFGDFALKVFIPKGTILYEAKIVQKILGLQEPLEDAQRSQLGQKIEFLYQTQKTKTRTWWITYSHSLAKRRANITPFKNAHPSEIPFGGGFLTNFEKDFRFLQKLGPSATYAKRLLTILFARNIHGFLEALYGSPENLEKVMSAAEFNQVEIGMNRWLFRSQKSLEKLDVEKHEKEQWVQNQLALLPNFFSDFTGAAKTTFIRTEPLLSKTLVVDPYQKEALLQNKNLAVEVQKDDGWRASVRFQYAPAATLQPKLTEFLEKLYDTITESNADSESEEPIEQNSWIQNLTEMIALAPFSKSNDMLIRAYFSTLTRANPSFGIRAPIKIFPSAKDEYPAILQTLIFQQPEDPLTRTFSKQQREILAGFSFAALKVAHGIVAETADAQRLKRNASYQNLPEQSVIPEVYRTTLEPKTAGALKQDPRILLQKLAADDLESLQQLVSQQTFWFSDYKFMPEIVQTWFKTGRTDLINKTMETFLKLATAQGMTLKVFEKAARVDFSPLKTRTEWIHALLGALPPKDLEDIIQDEEDEESWGISFPTVISTSSIYKNDEFLREVVGQYTIEKYFNPIVAMALAGKFEELDKKYDGSALESGDIQRALKLPRTWLIPYLNDLIKSVSGKVEDRFRFDVGSAIIHSTLLSGSTDDNSFREGLKVIQSYISLLKADAQGVLNQGDIYSGNLFAATSKLFVAKKISIEAVREAIRMMIGTPDSHCIKTPQTMINMLTQIEKVAPGSLQPEIHWLAKNLDSMVPDEEDRKDFRARIDKIIKPLDNPVVLGVSRPLSFADRSSPHTNRRPICSTLSNGKQ